MKSDRRTIDKLRLVNFTAFKDLTMEFSPGINAIIGENATGKTHVLKALYSLSISDQTNEQPNDPFPIDAVFHPSGALRSLSHLPSDRDSWFVRFDVGNLANWFSGPQSTKEYLDLKGEPTGGYIKEPLNCTYLPAKDILSHAPGFRSLFEQRHIHFDRTFYDVLVRAFTAPLRNPDQVSVSLIEEIAKIIGGKVITEAHDQVFIDYDTFRLDLAQVAEGHRKFALLHLLLIGGAIKPGSILFWDEPEANLNPKLMIELIKILLKLEQMGVQIFLTTHDYMLLIYLELLKAEKHSVLFHSLFRDEEGEIDSEKSNLLVGLKHNAIFDVFEDIFQRQMKMAAERIKID